MSPHVLLLRAVELRVAIIDNHVTNLFAALRSSDKRF